LGEGWGDQERGRWYDGRAFGSRTEDVMSEERERRGMPVWGWVLIAVGIMLGTCCIGGGLVLRKFIIAGLGFVQPMIEVDKYMTGLQAQGYTVEQTEIQGEEKYEKKYVVTSPEGEVAEYVFGFEVPQEGEREDVGFREAMEMMSFVPKNDAARELWDELGLGEEEKGEGVPPR